MFKPAIYFRRDKSASLRYNKFTGKAIMQFQINNPDFNLSPKTGMTRQHWIECARFIVQGAFSHVASIDAPMVFPKVPGKSYPQPNDPDWKIRAMKFEGLARSLNVAAPLMHVEPDVEINGIKLADYYRHQILQLVTPGNATYIPKISELPDDRYQMTCEFGGLSTILLQFPDVLWPLFSREEQDLIAAHLSDWGHGRTTSHNWRYFNVMMLTFLKTRDYPIDDDLLNDHLDFLMASYGGDGWFLDAHFDYYSVWVFHLYGIIWSRAWGDEHDPGRVRVIEKQFADLMVTYPLFFGRDGKMLMWGRSICYRFGATCAFPLASLAHTHTMDAGWARRIVSGALSDFVTRPEFWENGVPTLGFYGHFEPVLQTYSCAASPFWMFLPFVALGLPEDSPFWTATENDGDWNEIGQGSETKVLPGPGFAITAHGASGAAELRAAKVHAPGPGYSRLCYNTAFPWEDDDKADGGTAMAFSARSLDGENPWLPIQKILWVGEENGVIYRQITMNAKGHRAPIDVAEIIVPGGVLQFARNRVYHPHDLTLGHFGLPHIGGVAASVESFERNGCRGLTARIEGRRVALVAQHGWDELEVRTHEGKHPEAEISTVLTASQQRTKLYPGMNLLVTLLLHRCDNGEWSDAELFPIDKLETPRWMESGSSCGALVSLRDGREFAIDFAAIDGRIG